MKMVAADHVPINLQSGLIGNGDTSMMQCVIMLLPHVPAPGFNPLFLIVFSCPYMICNAPPHPVIRLYK